MIARIRVSLAVAVVASLAAIAAPAFPQPPHQWHFSADYALGALRKDPQASAVLQKFLPALMNERSIAIIDEYSLVQIQRFAPKLVPAEKIPAINAELALIPANKPADED